MEIWGHTVVKNEERYLWFAVTSVIDHLDKLLIYDSGSTDNTKKVIQSLIANYPKKIIFEEHYTKTPQEINDLRQKMVDGSKAADWIFILDGDEVWWSDSIKKLTQVISSEGNNLDSIVVPFINLVGDIFHYQDESFGNYKIDSRKGFLTIRAISNKIPGLHVDNPYPLEGFFDNQNTAIQDRDSKRRKFINAPYLHFSHLIRSRSLESDKNTLARGKKYKHQLGKSFSQDYFYPESLFNPKPQEIFDPWVKVDVNYKLRSGIRTPAAKLRTWIR